MSDKEKTSVPEENLPESTPDDGGEENILRKVKKIFSVQSPYADYAADNDKVSQMMYESEEAPKPDAKTLLRTALTAVSMVLVFIGVALIFSLAGSCLGLK